MQSLQSVQWTDQYYFEKASLGKYKSSILMITRIKIKLSIIKTDHNIPDHPYRILTIGGSGSGKTNALLNLVKKSARYW